MLDDTKEKNENNDIFDDSRIDLCATLLMQFIVNASEYNTGTFSPINSALQVLMQKPIVAFSCKCKRGKNGKLKIYDFSSSLVSSLGILEIAKSCIEKHRDNVDVFLYPSPTNSINFNEEKYRNHKKLKTDTYYAFVILNNNNSAEHHYFINEDDPDSKLISRFFEKCLSMALSEADITRWLYEVETRWLSQRKNTKKNSLEAAVQDNVSVPKIALPDFKREADRIIYSVFDDIYSIFLKTPLLASGKAAFFVRMHRNSNEEQVDVFRWIIPARQAQALSITGEHQIDFRVDEGSLIADGFKTGNPTIVSSLAALSCVSTGDIALLARGRDEGFRQALNLSPNSPIAIFPTWLCGLPYAVMAISLPERQQSRSKQWMQNYLLYSELVRSSINRRLRARFRDRYIQFISEIVHQSWARALSKIIEYGSQTYDQYVNNFVNRYNVMVNNIGYFMPFDLPILSTLEISKRAEFDCDWVGRIGPYNLFLSVKRNPIFTPLYVRDSNYVRQNAKNALRRAMRDGRLETIERNLRVGSPVITRLVLGSIYKVLRREESKKVRAVVIHYAPHSPMAHLTSEAAYTAHAAFKSPLNRIRLYSPGCSKSEDLRFFDHFSGVLAEETWASERLERRTDTVVFFLEHIDRSLELPLEAQDSVTFMHVASAAERIISHTNGRVKVIFIGNKNQINALGPLDVKFVDFSLESLHDQAAAFISSRTQ